MPIKRSDIISGNSLGPDIEIESKTLSEARKARLYQALANYAQLAMEYPGTDKVHLLRKVGRQLLPKDEIERIIPLSVDEYQAKEAVEMLNNGEMPPIKLEQDHLVFIRYLAGAKDTPMTRAYISAHVHLYMMARANPGQFPPTEEERQAMLESGQGQPASPSLPAAPEGTASAQPAL